MNDSQMSAQGIEEGKHAVHQLNHQGKQTNANLHIFTECSDKILKKKQPCFLTLTLVWDPFSL